MLKILLIQWLMYLIESNLTSNKERMVSMCDRSLVIAMIKRIDKLNGLPGFCYNPCFNLIAYYADRLDFVAEKPLQRVC